MRRIPDILNTSLRSIERSCFSNRAISKSVHSCSNNNSILFDCQPSDENKNHGNEYLRDNLSRSQFKVFNALMELSLKHPGGIYPSLDLLASMAKCARSTVQIAIKRFRELGIIKTEYRGYHQTLIYHINEFYTAHRNSIASLVKNVLMISLLLSTPIDFLKNRYLLKEKDVYFRLITKTRRGNVALDLTEAHYEEMQKYPKYVFDRTLVIFKKKIAEGIPIANHTGYFMGIFKQESVKSSAGEASTKSRQFKQDPKTGTTKPYVRPKTGPYAEYVPEPKRLIESDFDISMKLELGFHTKPNTFSKLVADMNLKKLSKEQRVAIMTAIHIDCSCRPNNGIEE